MKAKKILITALVALFSAAFMSGCKDDNVATVGKCPTVVSTSPANLATNVPLGQIVSVTFNEAMNPATLTPAAFTLLSPGSPGGRVNGTTRVEMSGTLTYDAATFTMSFTPSTKLAPGATYTGTVATVVKDVMGNALQVNYVWTFSTGALVAPTVASTDPINNAGSVALNKVVAATFSVPMDPLTITSTTFNVKQGTTAVAGVVSYTGLIASFTPSSPFASSVVYTGTVTAGAKNTAGTPLANDYVWTFSTGAIPTVLSTDPVNNATGVAFNKVVAATFNAPMDPLTITTTTFTVKQGATAVPGAVSYTGSTASFTPTSALTANTIYTATITSGAKNPAGFAIANNYVWTFTTGISPTVLSTDPLNNATGAPLNKVVAATFSVPMDPLTITATTFNLKQGVTVIAGAVSYTGSTASLTPSSLLTANTVYTATITTGAKNPAGISIAANYVWTFTTGTTTVPIVLSTDPLNLATGVALNKVIGATFNEAMDPLTITSSTFTILLGATPVAGVVNYSGTTATFTPSSDLLSGSTYTATVTTGAKDLGGAPLANNYVWSFNTSAPLGPVAINLNSVARFGIIAGVGVSNDAGFSVINNLDVGIYPGTRSGVTGFPPATIVGGAIYASDDIAPPGTAAMLLQAQNDLTAAYNAAAGATLPAPAVAPPDLGGKTLAPGIYTSASSMLLQNGDLTLDAQGDVNAVWIFQIGSGLTSVGSGPFPSASGGNVILAGGAQAKNVFWQVSSSAVIGDYTSFKGNILAFSSITMNSGAVAEGRMLARNASVVMTDTNIINKP